MKNKTEKNLQKSIVTKQKEMERILVRQWWPTGGDFCLLEDI